MVVVTGSRPQGSELSKSCQQRFAQLNTKTLCTSVLLNRQNTMTYAIHTGTHERGAKNEEFALKARGPRLYYKSGRS